jgi:hypothetical protein
MEIEPSQHLVALLVSTLLTLALLPLAIHIPHFWLNASFRNSMSGVRHFSFDDGVLSFEARHGVGSKSGWGWRCASLLLPTRRTTDCNRGSTNW